MIDYKATGSFISKLRKEKGLTQQKFAENLNVTHQAVSKWENGIALPDTEVLNTMADMFNLKIDDILNVNESGSDDIKFEFGLGIIPYIDVKKKDSLLHKIKDLRTNLKIQSGKEIPLIHIQDNGKLKELQYRISLNGKIIIDNYLDLVDDDKRAEEMLSFLELVINPMI
jgi:transcriptional regulator with XRE-family HTH domain